MSGTGRRGGTRRAAHTQAESLSIDTAAVPAVEPAVEVLDDRTVPIASGYRARSLGRSLAGAIGATVLVVGLAFGAAMGPGGAFGPASDREKSGTTAANDGGGGAGHETAGGGGYKGNGDELKGDDWAGESDPTEKPDESEVDATVKPDGEPGEKPDPTKKPDEKPDATKAPTEPIAIGLAIKEYHPVVEWGSCNGLDFDVYKIVRSTNSTVSWPTGEGDELIAVVERGGTRRVYDKHAPHGVKVWYRVFCVRKSEAGYKVLNASATKGIQVPEEPTPPDPVTLGLEASLADGGKVLLDWSACNVDGFAFYKVLSSTTNDDPSYLPWHDGTEVVGVVSEQGATSLEVWAPDAGNTAWYRVQCIGYLGDQKVLLGESAVVAVTMP
jgi:hypothetical protein